jgi:hypothetical protein
MGTALEIATPVSPRDAGAAPVDTTICIRADAAMPNCEFAWVTPTTSIAGDAMGAIVGTKRRLSTT